MNKKILSSLLALTMLLSAVACTTDTPPASSGEPTVGSTPAESAPKESTPAESTTEGVPSETEPPEPPEPKIDPTLDGTLWYYEDFEDYEVSSDSMQVASALGWKYSLSTDMHYASNTVKYSIAEKDGSKQLYIMNNHGKGKDSFITLLSERQFEYLHRYNYTYQYDVTYADSSEESRYIVLVSEFNGADYYNSCHIRNGGYGNHELYAKAWKRYADPSSIKGSGSVAQKLIGKSQAHDLLRDISISIRYAVNWETGHNVYIRVNNDGYPGSGKWTLIGKYDASYDGHAYLDPDAGGAAMAVKTGGKQNGYIDNIVIWCGNGDEPDDKSSPFLTSRTNCHKLIEKDEKVFCVFCGRDEEAIGESWLLTEAPAYDGGTPSNEIYLSGQALDPKQPKKNEVKTQLISSTNEAEFRAYCEKLEKEGYKLEYTRDADSNLFRSYIKDGRRIYTYYTAGSGEVRVTAENAALMSSVEDFSYTYEPKAGESSAIYQYGIPMRDKNHSKDDGYLDRGMVYVIRLADNSLIVIDGGEANQFTEKQVDAFMSFLRDITGAGANGKVKIATWYNTHGHYDHMQGFALVIKKYHESIDLQRVMFNLPSTNSDISIVKENNPYVLKMIGYLNQYYPNAKYLKPHTGMKLPLGDVTIETLQTHEDVVDAISGETEIGRNYNDCSMISKFTFGGGRTFLVLGDIDGLAASVLLENWSGETLKVDVMQAAHHVLNDLSELYKVIQVPIVFVPQALDWINGHSVAPAGYAGFKPYIKGEMCFFQNDATYGLGVVDGEIKKIYTRDVVDTITWSEDW